MKLGAAAAPSVSPHPPQHDSFGFVSSHHMADWEAHPAAGISLAPPSQPGINSRYRDAHVYGTAVGHSFFDISAVCFSHRRRRYTHNRVRPAA
jgi:hypothetical protein